MRRTFVMTVWVFAFLLLVPTSAHAWWEWIEGFSGPRLGWGWDIEMRLACFIMPDPREARRARQQADELREAIRPLKEQASRLMKSLPSSENAAELINAIENWDGALSQYRANLASTRALLQQRESAAEIELALASATAAQSLARQQHAQLRLVLAPFLPVAAEARTLSPGEQKQVAILFSGAVTELTAASESLEVVDKSMRSGARDLRMVAPAAGLLFSACSIPRKYIRRGSIDLGFHYVWGEGEDEFAQGQAVTLMMFTPSFSWRLASFLDAGTGGGVYWFSSPGVGPGVTPPRDVRPTPGLEPFSGIVLQPVRFDLHRSRNVDNLESAITSGFMVRVGTYWFPAGFDMNAFGNGRRKPGEIQWNVGLFYDLSPLSDFICRKKGTC